MIPFSSFEAYFYAAGISQLLHPLRHVPGFRRLAWAAAETHLDLLAAWLGGYEEK